MLCLKNHWNTKRDHLGRCKGCPWMTGSRYSRLHVFGWMHVFSNFSRLAKRQVAGLLHLLMSSAAAAVGRRITVLVLDRSFFVRCRPHSATLGAPPHWPASTKLYICVACVNCPQDCARSTKFGTTALAEGKSLNRISYGHVSCTS